MQHIFISYSRHDKRYARELADYLLASGFDVWIDDRIEYGSRWAEVIQRAIEDCAALVVIMSPRSRDSHWVQTECEYATQQRKIVFPLLLEGDVFFRYVSVQSVNVTDGALPPEAFLDELAEHAPRKRESGQDVAHPEVTDEDPMVFPSVTTPPRRSSDRRRVPLVLAAIVLIAALGTALALTWRNAQSGDPNAEPSDIPPAATPTGSEVLSITITESTGTEERACQSDWFFGNEFAVAGDCPLSGWSELDGLSQQWGDGVLIGIALTDTADDNARYLVLLTGGLFYDFVGDWDDSMYPVGSCVLQTVAGFVFALPDEWTDEQSPECPLQPVQFGTVDYQSGIREGEFIFYVGTPDDAVYRLVAPSSRPGTEGEWSRIR